MDGGRESPDRHLVGRCYTMTEMRGQEAASDRRFISESATSKTNNNRQVFWLTDRPTSHAFSADQGICAALTGCRTCRPLAGDRLESANGLLWRSYPITAAGPRWNVTTFPLAVRFTRTPVIASYSLVKRT